MPWRRVNLPGAGGAGLTNRVDVKSARRVSTVLSYIDRTVMKPARRISLAPVIVTTLVRTARRVTTFASGSTTVALAPARKVSAIAAGTPALAAAKPARRIEFVIQNAFRRGGSSVVNTGTAWTNPNNIVSGTAGKHDGLNATRAGQLGAATDGTLEISYPAVVNHGGQVISAVKLYFYVSQAGTALNNGGLVLSYSVDGGANWTVLETITGNVDHMAAGRVFDITAAVGGDWAKVGTSLKTRVRANLAVGTAAVTIAADAVEVEAMASMTWVP
jgi:hypothetical protein